MRIALLTLEASAAARAVRRFFWSCEDEIVLVGLSDPFGGHRGGMLRQTLAHLRQSGPRFIPYLVANFVAPQIGGAFWRLFRWHVDKPGLPLREACRLRSVRCVAVRDVNGSDWRQALRDSAAELVVSFHFDQIMHADTIAVTVKGGINVHAALLPRHRGPVPTVHALLEDQPVFGVTVHRLAPRIDAGAILARDSVALPAGTTALRAAQILHDHAVALLQHVIADLRHDRHSQWVEATLPYCGFPTVAQMRRLSRLGRTAAGWRDLFEAARLAV